MMPSPNPRLGSVSNARRIDKPWGYEVIWAETDRYVGKILYISAGHALSLQYHRVKDETISLLSGELELVVGEEGSAYRTFRLEPGQSLRLPPGVHHRLTALTACAVLEASTPELDDVVRLQDRYGRAG